jgi:hypothetical protein
MGLYQKIFNVMNESKSLDKDMTVANQYKAVSEKAMLNTVKPLLKNNGLIIIPIKADVSEEPKGNKSITQVNVQYKIIDVETGESEILVGVGNGADTQDKGAGKAFTYAYKAMLSKTFMLFSGEDTDNTHSDEITNAYKSEVNKQPKQQYQQQRQQQPQRQPQHQQQNFNNQQNDSCSSCGGPITAAEKGFSMKKYNRALCRNCQN